MEKRILTIKPGQKFISGRRKVTYVVKSVKDNTAMLVSEDGTGCMVVQMDELMNLRFKPIYD